jgi:hypothetical protein
MNPLAVNANPPVPTSQAASDDEPATPTPANAEQASEVQAASPSATMAPASAGTPGGSTASGEEQDVDKLADKVWAIIRHKLHIERERQRGF